MSASTSPAAALAAGRRSRARRGHAVVGLLVLAVLALWWLSLSLGETLSPPAEVWDALTGQGAGGAAFIVTELRLPRAVTAVLVGAALGAAGTTFQTVLGNPLASPDVIGISLGASAAAVIAIVVAGASETVVAAAAVIGAVATAAAVQWLAWSGGFSAVRIVLVGIAVAAMLQSVVAAVILRASTYDLQTAMRWLTGSLNNVTWSQAAPLAVVSAVALPVIAGAGRRLDLLRIGDDAARSLGVATTRTRLLVLAAAVTLVAAATAAAGPVAFVALLAGPVAVRLVGAERRLAPVAALVGAALVLAADLVSSSLLPTSYPVGVVTGALGAPFLLLLLIRSHRRGGAL